MRRKHRKGESNSSEKSKTKNPISLRDIFNADISAWLNKAKENWIYPIVMLTTVGFGVNAINQIDEKKKELDEKLIILEKDIKTNIDKIRDQAISLTNLNMQAGQNVMDLFQFTTDFSQRKISDIKRNVKSSEDNLKNITLIIANVNSRILDTNSTLKRHEKSVELLGENIESTNIISELDILKARVSNIREGLAHILGAIESERDNADKVLRYIPNSNIRPDYFTSPLAVCEVINSPVKVRAGPGVSYEQLSTLTIGKNVDQVEAEENGWIRLRYLTLIGYSDSQYFKCK